MQYRKACICIGGTRVRSMPAQQQHFVHVTATAPKQMLRADTRSAGHSCYKQALQSVMYTQFLNKLETGTVMRKPALRQILTAAYILGCRNSLTAMTSTFDIVLNAEDVHSLMRQSLR